MIYFNFNLRNPFSNRFSRVWGTWGNTPFPNKHWEIEVNKTPDILGIGLDLTTRTDHAGLRLDFALVGYSLNILFYDNRHWDRATGKWADG